MTRLQLFLLCMSLMRRSAEKPKESSYAHRPRQQHHQRDPRFLFIPLAQPVFLALSGTGDLERRGPGLGLPAAWLVLLHSLRLFYCKENRRTPFLEYVGLCALSHRWPQADSG